LQRGAAERWVRVSAGLGIGGLRRPAVLFYVALRTDEHDHRRGGAGNAARRSCTCQSRPEHGGRAPQPSVG
jgi:hypothetical protein